MEMVVETGCIEPVHCSLWLAIYYPGVQGVEASFVKDMLQCSCYYSSSFAQDDLFLLW